jgi:hypothetical protein
MKTNTRVNRLEDRAQTGATVLQVAGGSVLIEYDEGGQGWWPIGALSIVVDERWVDFSAAIMAMPAINVMLGAVLQAAPGLYGGLAVGLQNASEGDSRVFLNSWHAAIAMTLVSEELITTVQEIAGEYDLPQEFIGALVPLSPV